MTAPTGSLWVKDPDDTRWFEFDWSSFLTAGETISSYTVTVSGLTKVDDASPSTTTVAVQVSDGTQGNHAAITCNIHTSASNVYEATKTVIVRPRKV